MYVVLCYMWCLGGTGQLLPVSSYVFVKQGYRYGPRIIKNSITNRNTAFVALTQSWLTSLDSGIVCVSFLTTSPTFVTFVGSPCQLGQLA